jgi:HPt (histidine-containing phosphotransfer) domain-containing protein
MATDVSSNTVSQTSPIPHPFSLEDNVSAEVLGKEVLQRLLPELEAIPTSDLLQINLDIPAAVATVLGVTPRIRTHRSGVLALMPTFDMVLFDKLEDYALALNDVHGTYLTANKPADELAQALAEATELRAVLLADATALMRRGLLDSNALADLNGPVGYKNLATDLHQLAKALGAVLAQAVGKSGITAAELERATRLHQHIYRLVGLREQSEPAANAAGNLRQRAFTALLHCYDHVQRGITALRWAEGDADDIAPSLHGARGGTRKKPSAPTPEDPAKAAPLGAAAGATASALAVPPPGPGAAPAAVNATGKPGADPFLA